MENDSVPANEAMFYFDNKPIRFHEILEYFKIRNHNQHMPDINSEEFNAIKEEYINMLLLSKAFENNKLHKEDLFKQQSLLLNNNLKAEYYLSHLEEDIKAEDFKKTQDDLLKDYNLKHDYKIQMLLVKHKRQAWAFFTQIIDSPGQMKNLIDKHSFIYDKKYSNHSIKFSNENITTKDQRLILGVVSELKVGNVFQPIRLSNGYAIIRLLNRNEYQKIPMKTLDKKIKNYLVQKELSKEIKKLRTRHIRTMHELKDIERRSKDLSYVLTDENMDENEMDNNEENFVMKRPESE